jgi:hypothetical protein
MAVFRRKGFPRRQEDPLIQQLLERARQEYAKSSAIGSPSMYKAAAGGGIGPVAGVLTAQVLGGIRAGNAVRNAENRLARQDEFATKVSEIQRAIDAGPSEELIPGQITVSPEKQIESFRGVPYAPQPVTVGEPTEDRNMLGRVADALTGRERLEQETLSRNPQTALSQALRGAGINEIEYNLFQDQLKQKTAPKYDKIDTFNIYDDENQKKNVTSFLKTENGVTTVVLLDNVSRKFLTDTKNFSVKEPEAGTFTYSKDSKDIAVTTDDGLAETKGQIEYNAKGIKTGYAMIISNGKSVKVPISTLNIKKGNAQDFLNISKFESDEGKNFRNAIIAKSWQDVDTQIGKLNAIREAQEQYQNDQPGFIKYIKNELDLGENQIKSLEKTIADGNSIASQGIFDWASIFLFNKLLDEGSVVRDPEVKQTAQSAGVEEAVKVFLSNLSKGDKIGFETRQSISIVANTIRKMVEDKYTNHVKTSADVIKNWKERTPELKYSSIIPNWNKWKKIIDEDGMLYNNGEAW